MNISIFGSSADVVAAVSDKPAHPWAADGVLSVLVFHALPVGTGSLPLAAPVITSALSDAIDVCSVLSSAF